MTTSIKKLSFLANEEPKLTCDILSYALKDGCLVQIDEVKRGRSCGCICIACKEPLIARKGKKNIHHFAHYNSDCNLGGETALHQRAKEVLLNWKRCLIPSIYATKNSVSLSGLESLVSGYQSERIISFDSVEEEQFSKDRLRSDIVATNDLFDKIHFEIKVTHEVGAKKAERLQEAGLHCVEIDLSEVPRNVRDERLIEEVIYRAKRKWISNSHHADELKRKQEIEVQKLEQRKADYYSKICTQVTDTKVLLVGFKRGYFRDSKSHESLISFIRQGQLCSKGNFELIQMSGVETEMAYLPRGHQDVLKDVELPCWISLNRGFKRTGQRYARLNSFSILDAQQSLA